MPDLPDWHPTLPDSRNYPMKDQGELAARLGSLVSYDRRGDYLWGDDWRAGFAAWIQNSSSDNGDFEVVASEVEVGGFAGQVTASTTSPYLSQIQRRYGHPAEAKYGFALLFRPGKAFAQLQLAPNYSTPDANYAFAVRYNYSAEAIQVEDKSLSWTTVLSDVPIRVSQAPFYHFKVVVDLENLRYHRLVWGWQEVDLTSYTPPEGAATDDTHLLTAINLYGTGDTFELVVYDRVIVTVYEP